MKKKVDTQLVDFLILKKFGFNEQDNICKIIRLFKQRSAIGMIDMESAINQQDKEALKSIVHRVKPMYSYLGANKVYEELDAFEKSIQEINFSADAPSFLIQVKAMHVQVVDDLETISKEISCPD